MKIYIYMGLGHTPKDYDWLSDHEVIYRDIENNSIEELINEKIDEDSIVIGYSIGALVAYKLKTSVKKGIYCSMTTMLEGDRPSYHKYAVKLLGKENANYLKTLKYGTPKAKESHILYGDQERDEITDRFNPIYINNTGHEWTDEHIQAVLKLI